MKKKEIIEDIDSLIDDLAGIRNAIKEGKDMEREDPLDTLQWLTIGIGYLYENIKKKFKLKDEDENE